MQRLLLLLRLIFSWSAARLIQSLDSFKRGMPRHEMKMLLLLVSGSDGCGMGMGVKGAAVEKA